MFPNAEGALGVAKQYSAIAPTDFQWDESLTALLTESKAAKTYRPYIVAAFHLWSASGSVRSQLHSADGANFLKPADLKPAVEGLIATQEALDGNDETIPESWRADQVRLLCGCASTATSDSVYSGFVA